MNAYELASLLDFEAKRLHWKTFAEGADMLRQQAHEIVRLKLEWQFMFDMQEHFKTHAPMEYQAYLNKRMSLKSTYLY